ncbi:NAD(P)H-binding protein [Streptomyces sp. INA 01156]
MIGERGTIGANTRRNDGGHGRTARTARTTGNSAVALSGHRGVRVHRRASGAELLEAGHRVRCLARSRTTPRPPLGGDVETVRGDVTDADSVAAALHGIDVAYYLVHALAGGSGFEETDRRAARVFAEQAHAAGVRRIVYLGGLTPPDMPEGSLSPHLRSRAEVGRIFLDAPVPATVLRAAVVIGSGSASFEMLRYLTERLPVMVTPVGCAPGPSPSGCGAYCTTSSARPPCRPTSTGRSTSADRTSSRTRT